MSEPLQIGLIGCGTVGSGVAKLLLEQPERLAARAGRPLVLKRVVVRDLHKPRAVNLPRELLTTDVRQVIHDPDIQVAVEVVGGVDWARQTDLALLAAGKHLVTANKALLAQYGAEVFESARRHGRTVAFEASVAGGIPIIAALAESLAANQILALQGILNGTCNFILTGMTEHGLPYESALAEAQRRGYAEADPTLDVDGTDTAHKLAILSQIAFGLPVPFTALEKRGIAGLRDMDIRFAKELGYTIKLLAEAWLDPQPDPAGGSKRGLALHVSPVLLRHQRPLAQVRGPYNAIYVLGDAVGDTLFYGQGAGQMPTASSVVGDVIDLAVGRAQRTFQTMQLWSAGGGNIVLKPATEVRSRSYLRLLVPDRPGVLADVAGVLARHHISIASVIQHEALEEHEGELLPLVIMTHTASVGDFRAAVEEIRRWQGLAAEIEYFPVGD